MGIILDVLLLGLPVALGLLGVGRGIQREAVTLISILLGALVAEIGVPRWGPVWAEKFNQDLNNMMALIAVGVMLLSTIFIGYGCGLLLPARKQLAQGRSRWFGGVAGAINGMLVVGFMLRFASWRVGDPSRLITDTRLGAFVPQKLHTFLLFGMFAAIAIVIVRVIQRLILLIHGKPASKPAAAKPAAKPADKPAAKPAEAKPAEAPKPEPPKPPASSSVQNEVLRDLLKAEEQKAAAK